MSAFPRDDNRIPVIGGVDSSTGLATAVTIDHASSGLDVNVVAGASNTQYTDGSVTVTHPIGTMPVYDNAGTISKVSVANGLPVQPATGSTFTISGTVTANAGTNLNTSALALESGGNLATLAGGVSASKYQTNISQVGGSAVTLGQKVMSSSIPVAIASDQTVIPIKTNDTIDSNNSSTSTLLANASFTGTGTDTLGYTSVSVYIYSDQSSAANGVKIEFSSDNSNWNDSTTDSFTAGNAAPNDGQTFIATCRARYVRVVYTNGAVNQTAFRLNTALRVGTLSGDVIPVADVPNSIADHALLTKSAIVGKTTAGGGAWVDVKVNPSGALTVASTTQDSAGNSITSNSTTTTSTFGLDVNIRSILNTAPTTAGKLDVKGADGDVFVRQTTASNLNATVVGTGTFAVQAAQSGNWTSRIVGNSGSTLDAAVGAGTAPTNMLVSGAIYNSTEISPTTGQSFALQGDSKGRLRQVIMDAAGNTRGANVNASNQLSVSVDAIVSNQSVNVAQIAGNTTLTGNGTTGTGSQRVTISSDNTGIANWGQGATAATAPSGATYGGRRGTTALPTAVTDGQLVGAMSDKYGRQVSLLGTIRDLVGTQTTTISASTTETTIVTAAASIFNDIMLLVVSNTSASTNTRIDFRDTTGGSVLFSLESIGGANPVGFSLGGASIPQTTVNTNWTAQCGTSTTDVRIYAVFAKNK